METIDNLREQLSTQEAYLIEVYYMTEEEACQRWNVDYKDEAIATIEEKIESLRSDIARREEEELDPDAEMERAMYHPAFRSETDFWRFKY